MASLAYRALDAHVIAGLADELALVDGTVSLSYAQLLAEVAAVAGGLFQLGIGNRTPVALALHGRFEAIAVLACARLGAIPDERAEARIAGDPPVVHVGGEAIGWDLVRRAGKSDPEAAPASDEPGYAEGLTAAYPELFATLLAGDTAG